VAAREDDLGGGAGWLRAGCSARQAVGVGGDRLFSCFSDGDTPSRYYPSFKMSAVSGAFFDEGVGRVGAVIAGRRTYDISKAWGGSAPSPDAPLRHGRGRISCTCRRGTGSVL
jgi:hypothetical protein